MGEIVINVPQNLKRTFEVRDPELATEIIERLEALNDDADAPDADPDRVLGMWRDRFDKNDSSLEVSRRWRREFWQRF